MDALVVADDLDANRVVQPATLAVAVALLGVDADLAHGRKEPDVAVVNKQVWSTVPAGPAHVDIPDAIQPVLAAPLDLGLAHPLLAGVPHAALRVAGVQRAGDGSVVQDDEVGRDGAEVVALHVSAELIGRQPFADVQKVLGAEGVYRRPIERVVVKRHDLLGAARLLLERCVGRHD